MAATGVGADAVGHGPGLHDGRQEHEHGGEAEERHDERAHAIRHAAPSAGLGRRGGMGQHASTGGGGHQMTTGRCSAHAQCGAGGVSAG